MRKLFLWLEIVCLVYVLLGILNPLALPASPVVPWWLWAAVLGLSFLPNSVLSRRPRTLLAIIVVNILSLILAGVAPLIVYHLWLGSPLYKSVPALVETVLIWPVLVYIVFNDHDKKLRLGLLEAGIGLLLLGLLLSQKFQPLIFQAAATAAFLLSGLVNETLAATGLNRGFTVRDWLSSVLVAPVLLGGGLLFGWIFGSAGVGSLVNRLIAVAAYVLRKIGHWLDVTGLSKPVNNVTIPKVQGNFRETGSLDTAPLWVMIILWAILAGLCLFLLTEVIRYMIPRIRELLAILRSWKIGRDDRGNADLTRGDWYSWFSRTGKILHRRLIQWLLSRRVNKPHNLSSLYAFLLKWGKKNKLAMLTGETPTDYLGRLRPAMTDYPKVLQKIEILTTAYNRHRYGGFMEGLSKTEIELMAKQLRQVRMGIPLLRRIKNALGEWV